MLRVGVILLLLAGCAAVALVRHRDLLIRDRAPRECDSPDVAAAMRGLSGSHSSDSKLWDTQFESFSNAHPDRQFVVGRCGRPCLSEVEARESAHRSAAEQMEALVASRLHAGRLEHGWLDQQISRDVSDGRFDADRLAEQFDRPYGKVWTESVLLDVSPDRLDPAVAQYQPELNAQRAHAARNLTASGVLIGVASAAYLLLNALTQGYFTGRLRLATAAFALATVALLV